MSQSHESALQDRIMQMEVIRKMEKKNIVILGAGYGGMMTTVKLQKSLSASDANITLVNKHDYHYQSTWLHEVSAGTIHQDRARIRIKDVVNMNRVNFVQDTVVSIHTDEKKVKLQNGGDLSYDILVVGLGFQAATFGIPGIEEYAHTIGSINTSRLLRESIEYNFAMYNNEPVKNPARLNIVVGGGGFTGVEYLGEIVNKLPQLCKEYDIDKNLVRVINIEHSPTCLNGFDPQLVEYAMSSLESRGVEFINGAALREVYPEKVIYEKDGERHEIPTMNTVWAAGVRANVIVEESGLGTNRGKVEVTKDMRAPGHEDIFVIGDCAIVMDEKTGRPYPPTAQITLQEAPVIAHNIKALLKGGAMKEFAFNNMGTVASLGHNDATGIVLNNRKLFGWKATVMKKIIDNRYLFKLGGIGLLLKKGKFNIFY